MFACEVIVLPIVGVVPPSHLFGVGACHSSAVLALAAIAQADKITQF